MENNKTANGYFESANELYKEERYKQSYRYYKKALELFKSEESITDEIEDKINTCIFQMQKVNDLEEIALNQQKRALIQRDIDFILYDLSQVETSEFKIKQMIKNFISDYQHNKDELIIKLENIQKDINNKYSKLINLTFKLK